MRWRRTSKRELDRAAAANPNPGKLPLLHRLTRTEYQNAIRDLLALDALPKEMDYAMLLPADNASAAASTTSPTCCSSRPATMERYLDAARKISRLAVGDPNAPVMVNIHPLLREQPQDARVDELPFGTRGGLAVRSDFPAGRRVRLSRWSWPARRASRIRLEITVDGDAPAIATIGDDRPRRAGGRRAGPPPGEPANSACR